MIPIQLRIKLDTEFETSLVMLLAVPELKTSSSLFSLY